MQGWCPVHATDNCSRWPQALKKSRDQPSRKGPTVISKRYRAIGQPEFDVCVAGGTLGIFIALALQVC